MESNKVRSIFLDFFREKAHRIVPSAPIVNKDDPTLLFVNAGMNPFKDIFTGAKPVTDPRIADTQKCLRVSGKHNDLEEVGHDTYHHTLFEMLGNWSFGDYFRDEMIPWAWELLVKVLGIDPNIIYVTVFAGEQETGIPRDDASAEIWKRFLPEDRILYFDKKANFWEMGDTGPCGPCTEIHVDLRSDADRAAKPGRELVNEGHSQVIEIWNIVLIQYNRKADGSLEQLAMKSIDTGMGFERLCMVLQGVRSTYDTDVFTPHIKWLEQATGLQYGSDEMVSVAMRVAVDHIRAVAFAIADGQLPGNTGAGYVIRRLLRRASRYGFRYLNFHTPYLYKMVDGLAAQMGHAFPELVKQLAFIRQIIEQEEKGFIQKLERGSRMFEEYVRERSNQPNNTAQIVDGNFAFELYDTFGFPLDLTELMARERGWKVDTQTFAQNMAAQRERARAATQVQAGDWVELYPQANPIFVGYDKSETSTRIVRYRTVSSKKGNAYHIVLEETPFYAESGGQVGDTGYLFNGEERIQVLDTVRENDLIIHITDALPSNADDVWTATIDMRRRRSIRANHSATHLLQAALQKVLGSHIEQRGSLVNDEYLRFDFSHFQKLSEDEIEKIETLVNDRIADALDREEFREMPIEEAKRMGAMALFGEKYGEKVRVIRFGDGFSTELCGGTHVDNTQEIRIFKIVSESSIAAGIRRIEAVTGTAALAFFDAQIKTLEHIKAALKNPQNVEKALLDVLERNKQLEAQLEKFRTHRLVELRNTLSQEAQQTAKGIKLICQKVTLDSAEEVKSLSFELRKMHSKTAIILGGIFDAKPHLSVMFTDDIADQYNAVEIIRKSAQHIKGGGGGQPFYATAGGKEPEGLDAALAEAQKLLN